MPLPDRPGGRWTVRPFEPGDEHAVLRLYAEVFRRPLSPAYYRWKLVDSPWSVNAPNVWVADTGSRIVGHYAGTPLRFELAGEVLHVLHGCDVMTASDYRRQGILTALGTRAHQAWAAAGVPFVFGLHYGGWGTRRRHLGWQEMFKARWLRRPLRPAQRVAGRVGWPRALDFLPVAADRLWNAAWRLGLGRIPESLAVAEVSAGDDAFDVLWGELRGRYQALIVRDRSWIAYRYGAAPDHRYRLLMVRREGRPAGYLAYRTTDGPRGRGWIVDLFTDEGDSAGRAALVRAALQRLAAEGLAGAWTLAPCATGLAARLRRAGFRAVQRPQDISLVPLASSVPAALHDPRRWFTALGDYDLV